MKATRKAFIEIQKESTESILEFLERTRRTLNAGETYDVLIKRGYVSPCPTTITSSSIAAIYYALKGDIEAAIYSYSAAFNYRSPYGDYVARSQWVKEEVKKLTGIELYVKM